MALTEASATLGEIGLRHPKCRTSATAVLRDVTSCAEPARFFASIPNWREYYETDPLSAWQRGSSTVESLYQHVHKVRGSLANLIDPAQLQALRASESYQWCAGTAQTAPKGRTIAVARELAWIDRVCTVRNRAVQHRQERQLKLRGYVVEATAFSALYARDDADVSLVSATYGDACQRYGIQLAPSGSVEDAAYLTSVADQVHDLDPEHADTMRRVLLGSRVYVVQGSHAFVQRLDSALAASSARWSRLPTLPPRLRDRYQIHESTLKPYRLTTPSNPSASLGCALCEDS